MSSRRRTGPSILKPQVLYILVMGLTGAGKSTFISIVTENADIPIGEASQMDGGMKFSFVLVSVFCID